MDKSIPELIKRIKNPSIIVALVLIFGGVQILRIEKTLSSVPTLMGVFIFILGVMIILFVVMVDIISSMYQKYYDSIKKEYTGIINQYKNINDYTNQQRQIDTETLRSQYTSTNTGDESIDGYTRLIKSTKK